MKRFIFLLICFSVLLFLVAGQANAKQEELPEITVEGLHRVPDSKMAVVYAEPGVDLAQYQRIKLLSRQRWRVSFTKFS